MLVMLVALACFIASAILAGIGKAWPLALLAAGIALVVLADLVPILD